MFSSVASQEDTYIKWYSFPLLSFPFYFFFSIFFLNFVFTGIRSMLCVSEVSKLYTQWGWCFWVGKFRSASHLFIFISLCLTVNTLYSENTFSSSFSSFFIKFIFIYLFTCICSHIFVWLGKMTEWVINLWCGCLTGKRGRKGIQLKMVENWKIQWEGVNAELLNATRIKKSISKWKNGKIWPHKKGLLLKLVLESSGCYLSWRTSNRIILELGPALLTITFPYILTFFFSLNRKTSLAI